MLDRGLKGLLAVLAGTAVLALAGCSTPCDAPGRSGAGRSWPGRLCAPIASNTSTPLHPRAGLPAPQQVEAVREQTLRVEPAPAHTMPVAPPEAINSNSSSSSSIASNIARNSTIRIALLLPLRSDALGAPAGALRAGFMAAYGRDPAGFTVNLVETGDSADDTLGAYALALENNDLVVGPLARSAVGALAASALVRKPTIALNHPEVRSRALPGNRPLPPQMLVIGLSIEDEARQVAEWAAAEHPGGAAMIISGSNAWQRRIAASFAARWRQLGQRSQLVELADSTGILGDAALEQLRNQADAQPPALLFAALDAGQAGQVRDALGADLPMYGTSSVNPGARPAVETDLDLDAVPDIGPGATTVQLDGLRLLDLPWEVQPEHQAVMAYPRWSGSARSLDMDRLYALGIDAFRVARELALRPRANFQLDGVTGRLSVSFGASDGAARFERVQPAVLYQDGAFMLLPLVPLLPLPPPPLPER